ncbi:CoA-transferase family III [Sodiomyces alkalinus F11]|uniref:CoA-transferase family III n=1 Tax=Sodiomyces alkalinus (strain CBS 110278 / VKM F-3762 / F11) TaxID=1314773 RepID=A0A3N2PLE1_SODAK|nr:CoA-transferase family III [Sodiomyces alkalinus F11]ROT35156.1 CoA-transferase family III [Sodiomyces alkalinus F11]
MTGPSYSMIGEIKRILDLITSLVQLPLSQEQIRNNVTFTSPRELLYFPIPFKETEVASALKAIEGSLASALAALENDGPESTAPVIVSLERTTAFLFQAYLASVGGFGKLDEGVKAFLPDTDLLQAQSDPYRRMSANLYETKRAGEYYHIHGSLEASTTLRMIGLEPFRPDLHDHDAIVETIESKVRQLTVEELEELNAKNRQAGIPALQYDTFCATPHGKANIDLPPWTVDNLEETTPPTPLPRTRPCRVLSGVRVLELCRIIAGPVMGRILAEYGADVLKITGPNLSDVPFFQVDGNMGKHAAEIDLKSDKGRKVFEALLEDADVVLDGYRPGTFERLGYGPKALAELAKKRGKGIVYVNENCFGYEGPWAHRPGWQQIADCVSGVAWEQGKFMNLNEPVVPPFPISDYGTGCMGAIAALTGLHHRATKGGSWHGKVSLLQYDLLLFKVGMYPEEVRDHLRREAGEEFLALRHSHSVDQISGTALRRLQSLHPHLFDVDEVGDSWYSGAYDADVVVVRPVVEVVGLGVGFERASRPNATDAPSWNFLGDDDYWKEF